MQQIKVCRMIGLFCLVAALATVLTSCGKPKPPLPVDMRYRQSAVGAGYVWMFRNTLDKDLTIWVTFRRGFKTLQSGEMTIPANSKREVGWLEGVELQQGDRIEASHPDYSTYESYVPKSFDY